MFSKIRKDCEKQMPIIGCINRKILIVDDETVLADSLAMIFTAQRYEVRTAYSAEEAIETLSKFQPDLAILDVVLPRMNGIDLAITVRDNYPSCRTILFSGNSNTGALLEEAARKGHSFDVLAKPVHPELMLQTASELLSLNLPVENSKLD